MQKTKTETQAKQVQEVEAAKIAGGITSLNDTALRVNPYASFNNSIAGSVRKPVGPRGY
jgi:hypothetical protein